MGLIVGNFSKPDYVYTTTGLKRVQSLSLLPNKKGFEFYGVYNEKSPAGYENDLVLCRVSQAENGCHFVTRVSDNYPIYDILRGWVR